MRWQGKLILCAITAFGVADGTPAQSQQKRFITPPDSVVALRAGRLFDSRTGTMLNNQVVLIRGDRITDVGVNTHQPLII
jgi:hypothetical protein